MRLPPRPDLQWKEDGTPVDPRVDDVYYSVQDGLAETRAVFLAGCGLPEAWQDRTAYTIAELGFGTGLNFLATWQMWRKSRPEHGWLSFVSFEGFPLDAEDIARAMQPWPELADLTEQLCEKWPSRAYGVRHLVWPSERLSLTLHIGLIEDALPQARFKADAWFLDGFSPAKNSAMWDEKLWPLIAERSAPGARVGTFTVAGAVRRGLASAGFTVDKRPGYGRKRERLEAVFESTSTSSMQRDSAPKVAVIGAGISGACLAHALRQRGANVSVFDQSTGPGQGTSGNPLALVMPRLDAGDTAQARLLIDAYLKAQAVYAGLPGVIETETVHRPRDEQEAARFQAVLADPPVGLEQLEALRGGGLLHKKSLILHPERLVPSLLDGQDVNWGAKPNLDLEARTINGESYDAIILAAGWQLSALAPELGITHRLGQVDWIESEIEAPPSAIAEGHYAIALKGLRLWGATFADHPGGAPATGDTARDQNRAGLETLAPYWTQEARQSDVRSRAGVRATTADRLPLIGPLPDIDAMAADRADLERAQWKIGPNAYGRPGLFVAGGYGSRGFTWAPWSAAILTAALFGDPAPARAEALSAVTPNRLALRRLKRQPSKKAQKDPNSRQ